MHLFYDNKNGSFHLRDIARKSKLNENSASRFLNELEKNGLLCSKREGSLKKYSIVKNKETFAVFSIFDIEKFEKLPALRKRAVDIFLQKLENPPIFALLFGSTAKENFSHKSDIDILLVFPAKNDTSKAESEAEALTGLKIQCVQLKYKDLMSELKLKEDAVIQSALHSGYPIINQVYFYEVVYNG